MFWFDGVEVDLEFAIEVVCPVVNDAEQTEAVDVLLECVGCNAIIWVSYLVVRDADFFIRFEELIDYFDDVFILLFHRR